MQKNKINIGWASDATKTTNLSDDRRITHLNVLSEMKRRKTRRNKKTNLRYKRTYRAVQTFGA
jgi:hypothetical protein